MGQAFWWTSQQGELPRGFKERAKRDPRLRRIEGWHWHQGERIKGKSRASRQELSQEIQSHQMRQVPNEPSIWEKLFWNFQPPWRIQWGNPLNDLELGNILQWRSELRRRYNRKKHKWETYWQTMCAKEGRLAFECMTWMTLPPGDALQKFINMKQKWWQVIWDGHRRLDPYSIPSQWAFCLWMPASNPKNRKYWHFVSWKDGYVFDLYMSKAPIPLVQYAQIKPILYAFNPNA